MRTLILIRHGEVANPNHVVYADLPGFDLSPLGVLEAHAVGRHLDTVPIDVVVSSPLPRARHTAAAIAAHHGLEVCPDVRLTEARMYPGWTGLRWVEVDEMHHEQLTGYLRNAAALDDVVESIHTIAERMVRAVYDSFGARQRVVAMVGHQDPIQAVRLKLLGRPLSELRRNPPGHASATTLLSTGSDSWVETSLWEPSACTGRSEGIEDRYTPTTEIEERLG
ncbi:hypothetical protein MNBD_ACTINO01-1594 [hydrothermal vent metagenome]|uniref:phosphoglycerate mutase (2,3-diphosphoglycerate-dependent) n=1 Tax=hydrothermal vent metagenome TaxID=652676 RepID=A0A3B0SKC3_9ZZZZ